MDDAGVRIDHVVIGVPDLDAEALAYQDLYGLTAIDGGRHHGWGTANRLIPLGDTYLELVTVVDRAEASRNSFGRWVSAMLDGGPTLGWAVRTDDLDVTASRLGLDVINGSRRARDGALLQWQIAGVAQATGDSALPFFIQWPPSTPLPGRANAHHRAGAVALASLRIEGDEQRLHAWLGTNSLPLDVKPGSRGLTSFMLATPVGTIEVSSGG